MIFSLYSILICHQVRLRSEGLDLPRNFVTVRSVGVSVWSVALTDLVITCSGEYETENSKYFPVRQDIFY